MKPKLYIINNGLKDLRGHYFETAVSIAEASEAMGLHPVLAAHVTCPRAIIPGGLEFHAAFTTDHWMREEPQPQPDLRGLPGELAPPASHTFEALLAGKVGFDDYVQARFFPDTDVRSGGATTSQINLPTVLRSTKRRVKQAAKAILPRALRKELKRQLALSIRLGRMITRGFLDSDNSQGGTPRGRLERSLERFGVSHESEYSARFRHDLERLLCLTGCSSGDHVFLPTAHGRELCAVLDVISDWPHQSPPMFHLEFRHALALAGDGALYEQHPYGALHGAFFEFARSFPVSDRLRLYTDSDGLSEEYERLSGLEFDVLPIPFRSRLLNARSRGAGPLCIGYLGDVRDEKGFHWLPHLVKALIKKNSRQERVRFLIQASLANPEHASLSRTALKRLQHFPEDSVRLVGQGGPLAPDLYYQLVSETDLLVCPYHPAAYRNRTSGTFSEALAAGIPTVVPHGSWLSRQQPPGSGETFLDRRSFIEAVRLVCDDYSRHQACAKAGQRSWLTCHSPESLVRSLLGQAAEPRSNAGKVA